MNIHGQSQVRAAVCVESLDFILPEKGNMNRFGLHEIILINDPLNSFFPLISQFLIQHLLLPVGESQL